MASSKSLILITEMKFHEYGRQQTNDTTNAPLLQVSLGPRDSAIKS